MMNSSDGRCLMSASRNVRHGDLRREPGHGPLFGWAPKATEEDMKAYRAQGSVCICSACERWRRGDD